MRLLMSMRLFFFHVPFLQQLLRNDVHLRLDEPRFSKHGNRLTSDVNNRLT